MTRTWRNILRESNQEFLAWLDHERLAKRSLSFIADNLVAYLRQMIRTPEDALRFWNCIPSVRAACNEASTYEQPFAAQAYAYVHLLDRYWRTWDVLRELTRLAALPLGKEGVRVLDIGTGPGPTPYALQDFYALLREFGTSIAEPLLAQQQVTIAVVERSRGMQWFLSSFGELSRRYGPFAADHEDFFLLDPAGERRRLEQDLRSREWYEPTSDEYFNEYSPEEANNIAQRHHRYRLLIFSNFFTVGSVVEKFSMQISRMLHDLRFGGSVIVLGAKGNQYGAIYDSLSELAKAAHMQELPEVQPVMGGDSYARVAETIKRAQYAVYLHLATLCGDDSLQKTNAFPDYWNPAPYEGRRTEFSLRVFRKGRWPRSIATKK